KAAHTGPRALPGGRGPAAHGHRATAYRPPDNSLDLGGSSADRDGAAHADSLPDPPGRSGRPGPLAIRREVCRMKRLLWLAAGALLVWIFLAWLVADWLGLAGPSRWILRTSLWLIGAAAAALVVYFVAKNQAA